MFIKMRRFKQEMTKEECEKVLRESKRGVLSLNTNDYPYGVPLSYFYSDGVIYFHGAKQGYKLDCIKNNPKACFTVTYEDASKKDSWVCHFDSVMAFGDIEIVDDKEECLKICKDIALHFTDDIDYINGELKNGIDKVTCLKLKIEHLSGKHIKES